MDGFIFVKFMKVMIMIFLISNLNSPENENIFKKLKTTFDQFEIIRQTTDYNDENFKKIISAGKKLTEENSKLKRDFPEDVKKFLNAIQNDNATLNLFTKEVIEWVKQTNSLKRYKIIKNENQK